MYMVEDIKHYHSKELSYMIKFSVSSITSNDIQSPPHYRSPSSTSVSSLDDSFGPKEMKRGSSVPLEGDRKSTGSFRPRFKTWPDVEMSDNQTSTRLQSRPQVSPTVQKVAILHDTRQNSSMDIKPYPSPPKVDQSKEMPHFAYSPSLKKDTSAISQPFHYSGNELIIRHSNETRNPTSGFGMSDSNSPRLNEYPSTEMAAIRDKFQSVTIGREKELMASKITPDVIKEILERNAYLEKQLSAQKSEMSNIHHFRTYDTNQSYRSIHPSPYPYIQETAAGLPLVNTNYHQLEAPLDLSQCQSNTTPEKSVLNSNYEHISPSIHSSSFELSSNSSSENIQKPVYNPYPSFNSHTSHSLGRLNVNTASETSTSASLPVAQSPYFPAPHIPIVSPHIPIVSSHIPIRSQPRHSPNEFTYSHPSYHTSPVTSTSSIGTSPPTKGVYSPPFHPPNPLPPPNTNPPPAPETPSPSAVSPPAPPPEAEASRASAISTPNSTRSFTSRGPCWKKHWLKKHHDETS